MRSSTNFCRLSTTPKGNYFPDLCVEKVCILQSLLPPCWFPTVHSLCPSPYWGWGRTARAPCTHRACHWIKTATIRSPQHSGPSSEIPTTVAGRLWPDNCVYKIVRPNLHKEPCTGTIPTKLSPLQLHVHHHQHQQLKIRREDGHNSKQWLHMRGHILHQCDRSRAGLLVHPHCTHPACTVRARSLRLPQCTPTVPGPDLKPLGQLCTNITNPVKGPLCRESPYSTECGLLDTGLLGPQSPQRTLSKRDPTSTSGACSVVHW